jgi:type II secretory pathway predicted ATPase ExeA
MSYLEFFALEQEPFSNAPVSKFYFHSNQHDRALMRLDRVARQMKGFALLVGDIGAGKTTLARRMLEHLPEREFEAALLVIIHSGITADWLIRRIAQQLGVQKPAQERLALLSQLYRRLLQIADQGKKAVVLIDEAQMLKTKEIMEEFRGLLNLEVPERKLLTFIFFGLPEIEENLKLDPPLLQRMALKYHLDAFDSNACAEYIGHRLKLAGAQRPIFESEAIEAIYRYSRGIPRLINTLADNALFEAFILKSETIGRHIVENISVDLGLSLTPKKRELRVIDSFEVEPARVEDDPLMGTFSEAPDEPTKDHGESGEEKFERDEKSEGEDLDSILSNLEEKL